VSGRRREKCEGCWLRLGPPKDWSFVWCPYNNVGASLHHWCLDRWDSAATAERVARRGESMEWAV